MNAQVHSIKPGRLDIIVDYLRLVDQCKELEELMYERQLTNGQDYTYWGISDELNLVVQQRMAMHDKFDISWLEVEAVQHAGY